MRSRFSFASVAVALLASTLILSAAPKSIVLFNGKNTDHWRGYKQDGFPSCWSVENGTLRTIPGKGELKVDLVTKEKYGDFDLELEWKVTPGANSGVIYRVSEDFDRSYQSGPEYQVLDDEKNHDGKNPKTSAGALYALIAPTNKVLKPVGEWNKARIIVKNGHVEHWLNGKKVVEYQWGSDAVNKLIAESKFAQWPNFMKEDTGHIALQHHGGDASFRNIRIKKLD
jgi:hypothetical protein